MARTAARERASHRCSDCGTTVAKWVGQCPECQAWGTIAEAGPTRVRAVAGPVSSPALLLTDVDAAQAQSRPTGEPELDRVLGGGLVPGAVVLLAGEPGAGKSTLSLAVAARCAAAGSPTLYVTGEESAAQVRLRAGRTGALAEGLWVAAETDLSAVLAHIDAVQPALLIVDSVQTIAAADVDGTAGGVTQVRAVAAALIAVAKERGIATVLVGHVTKDGSIAGPRLLEHLVDVVLHFEGDRHSTLRLLRAVKNRYGAADEIGCFQMTETGIEGLADPSGLFLSRGGASVPGTCVTVTLEGRRPLLAEVQALVTDPSKENSPRRAVSGLESGRVAMVLAVAEKRAGAKDLGKKDVHTATVGGVDVSDPGADLALLLALHSAIREQPVPGGLVAVGEVGLSGEIRPVLGVPRRLAEAARLGFTCAVVPVGSGPGPDGMRVLEVPDVDTALRAVNGLSGLARRTVPRP
ncbi:MAG TPA: DNA repair protein RadA [Mycobacteriales bacterium]|jgi:DNA repair protein RadA/Sms|nr:DNA repair protein RadA [Mycobacteriales bacterium]